MATVKLLPYQKELLLSKAKFALMAGGIGAGKSWTLAHYVINMVQKYPNAKGLICANTYSQLQNATLTALTQELDELGIPFKLVLGGTKKQIKILNTTIYLYSLEKYDNIRGIEVGWIAGDEALFAKKEAIDVIMGRLRDSRGPLQVRFFSSTNGYNWAYDMFGAFGNGKHTAKFHLINCETQQNTFLDSEYYETLLELYGGEDSPLAQQELFGKFVNLNSSGAYWAFDREKHVRPCKLDSNYPVYRGTDFNAKNMCGVYVQFINGKFYVTSEDVLTGQLANTFSTADKIVKDAKKGNYRPIVIPDSTGNATKSSSTKTDHQILRDAGIEVLPTFNPLIKDRWNAMNLAFKRGDLIIDESCKELIKEIETLSVDDKEGDVAHISVALGYVVHKLKPIRRPKRQTTSTYL